MKKGLQKIVNIWNHIEEYFLVYTFMLMVLIVFVQVIMRYIFNNSLSWSEELTRYIFIWQIWLGASVGFKNGDHIRVEIFGNKLPKIGKEILYTLIDMLILAFYVFLIKYGWEYVQSVSKVNMTSAALRMPLKFVYVSLPVGAVVIFFRVLGSIVSRIKNIASGCKTEKGEV